MKQGQQDIEHRDSRGQASLDEGFQAMIHPLEATNDREQRERGLHAHAVVPLTFRTQLAVLRHAAFLPKAVIGEHDTATAELLDQLLELVVRRVHGIPIPIDNLAEAIEHPTQLDPDAPPSFVFGLLAELLWTTPLPNGKQQFNREAVDDQEKAGVGQKPLVPVLMGDQQTLDARAIRQPGKQGLIVAFEPAIKGTEVASWRAQTASRSSPIRLGTIWPGYAWEPLSFDRRQNRTHR
jgi:hypothetical protein